MPFPSPIDLVYLSGYPLMLVTLVWFWRRHTTGALGGLLESAIIATAFAAFTWAAVIAPAGGQRHGLDLVAITAISYPALDAMLLVGLGQLLMMRSLRHTRALQAMTLGIAVFLVSDVFSAFGSVRGTYVGSWRDTGWVLAYVLWGFAGLHPSMRSLGTSKPSLIRRPWVIRTSVLTLACLGMPIAILIAARREALNPVLFVALGSFMIAAVFLRMGLILRVQQRREDELA